MLEKIIAFFKSLFGGGKSKKPTTPTPRSTPVTTNPPKTKPKPQPQPKPKPKPVVQEKINFTPPTTTLYLGCYDENVNPAKIEELLKLYHIGMVGVADNVRYKKFRHGDLFDWVDPKKLNGDSVSVLQKFLNKAGFLPYAYQVDGVFGYATQAAVRLFQEYVRTIEKNNSIGIPDGVIGKNGWSHIKRWADNHKTAEAWARGKQSPEFTKWLSLLSKAKAHYKTNSHPILGKVNEMVETLGSSNVDTLKLSDWNTATDEVHLIGVRRKEEEGKGVGKRLNDDLFILLINGMVFKFWGSTDPNYKPGARPDEAFLVEGQHKFRFGWHNRSQSNQNKVYQGLNPFTKGVLVFRDRNNDNKLTDADIQSGGIDKAANNTINIHWTGAGKGASGTWSAGCQVFAGQNYINNNGDLVDCSKFAGAGTKSLTNRATNKSAASLSMTKGAYNMFTDLVLLYRPKNVDYMYYTLGRDETFAHKFVIDMAGNDMLSDTLSKFKLPGDQMG